MDLGITGRIALVTGASRGLGRAIAARLASEGATVVAVARSTSDLDDLAAEIGPSHVMVEADLVPDGAPRAVLEQLRDSGPWPFDIIVHNVGGTLDINDPHCGVEDWRRVWRFNLEIGLELNEVLLPEMMARRWGRVLNVSSIAATENQGPVPYCSVKAALNAYTRSMGRVVSSSGVIMTAILPGAVFTEGGYWDTASRERPDHVEKYLAERMSIGRFGHVDEISGIATVLCSDLASFCVGSIVPVDGGQGRNFFEGSWA